MTLRSLAQELTEPHLKSINGRIGKVPALLSELREAVSGSSDTGGSGSSSKARILVNATALDLLNKITNTVRTAYSDRYGQSAPILDTCIDLIGKSEHNGDWEKWFTVLFEGIKTEIETMLRPKKLRRLDGLPCPSCSQTVHGEERETCLYLDCYINEDKELKHIQEWSVQCVACQAEWGGQELKWLLVALSE